MFLWSSINDSFPVRFVSSRRSTVALASLFAFTVIAPQPSHAAITISGETNPVYNGSDPWSTTNLTIGRLAPGSMTIDDGSVVLNGGSWGEIAAFPAASTSTVIVSGFGSLWNNQSDNFYVGTQGTATLDITSGGEVSSNNSFIGYGSGGNGTVTVGGYFGTTSTWSNTSLLFVGFDGTGALNITGGGEVSSSNTTIGGGGSPTGNGTVTVGGGSGQSTLYSFNGLTVGSSGTGTLNINSGGVVSTFGLSGGNGLSSVNINGGTLRITGTSSASNTINLLSSGGTIDVATSQTFTVTSALTGAGGLIKDGNGVLVLTAANSYNGSTTVGNGTLKLGGSHERLPDSSALTVFSGATFDMATFNETIGSLAGSGNVIDNGSLVLGVDGTSTTFSGQISGTGRITKTGAGTFELYGINSYAGSTTISGGTLSGDSIANSGSNSAFGRGNFTISNGATLQYTGNTASTNRTIAIGTGGATIDVYNSGTTLTVSGAITGFPETLTKTGDGKLTITASNTFGNPFIYGGTLSANSIANGGNGSAFGSGTTFTIGYGSTMEYTGSTASTNRPINLVNSGTVSVTNSSTVLSLTRTTGGAIRGTGDFTKTGAGTLALVGGVIHSGATFINQGTLRLENSELLPNGSAVTVASGATSTSITSMKPSAHSPVAVTSRSAAATSTPAPAMRPRPSPAKSPAPAASPKPGAVS